MMSPILRFTFAACAWLLAVFVVVSQDHHGGQLVILLSIVFALVAVVPKGEMNLKVTSPALRAADFLANAYLLVFALVVGFGVIQIALKINAAL